MKQSMTPKELAEATGCSDVTIRDWIKNGRIQAEKDECGIWHISLLECRKFQSAYGIRTPAGFTKSLNDIHGTANWTTAIGRTCKSLDMELNALHQLTDDATNKIYDTILYHKKQDFHTILLTYAANIALRQEK